MDAIERLRRLAESNEKAERRYYEDETGPRLNAWEEAEHRLLSTTLELLPAIRRELEAVDVVLETMDSWMHAFPRDFVSPSGVRLDSALEELRAARAAADEEARKCDEPD